MSLLSARRCTLYPTGGVIIVRLGSRNGGQFYIAAAAAPVNSWAPAEELPSCLSCLLHALGLRR
jgi:hypothetical protein